MTPQYFTYSTWTVTCLNVCQPKAHSAPTNLLLVSAWCCVLFGWGLGFWVFILLRPVCNPTCSYYLFYCLVFRCPLGSSVSTSSPSLISIPCFPQPSLGAKGNIPSGYIMSSLWVLKQFTQLIPSGYMVGTFKKYPPIYPAKYPAGKYWLFSKSAHQFAWLIPSR